MHTCVAAEQHDFAGLSSILQEWRNVVCWLQLVQIHSHFIVAHPYNRIAWSGTKILTFFLLLFFRGDTVGHGCMEQTKCDSVVHRSHWLVCVDEREAKWNCCSISQNITSLVYFSSKLEEGGEENDLLGTNNSEFRLSHGIVCPSSCSLEARTAVSH